ncbi:MAG: helix-turn-helix transcriptional regulator [Planctomycetaceae bacterium]
MTADSNATTRLLLTAEQVAQALGVSLRFVRTCDSTGRLPRGIKLGRSKRWRADELRRWCDAGCPPRDHWEHLQSDST